MSIYVDGERSRQRLGFAKSLLNKIKAMGMRTKKLIYDGFLYRVDNIAPGLSKIAVTAPMGSLFVCATRTQYKVMWGENYLGVVNPSLDLKDNYYTLGGPPTAFALGSAVAGASGTAITHTATTGTPPVPAVVPCSGEFINVYLAYNYTNAPLDIVARASVLSFSFGSGGSKSIVSSFFVTRPYLSTIPATTAHPVATWGGAPYPYALVVATDQYLNNVTPPVTTAPTIGFARVQQTALFGGLHTSSDVFVGTPTYLYSKITALLTSPVFTVVGGYGYQDPADGDPVLLQCLDASPYHSDLEYYGEDDWAITLSFFNVMTLSTTVLPLVPALEDMYNFSHVKGGQANAFQASYTPVDYAPIPAQIAAMVLWRPGGLGDGVYDPVYTAIDDGGSPPTIIRYDLTAWVINQPRLIAAARQVFPWPNVSRWAPIDSAMFRSHDGKIIVVSKSYPTVALDATSGMQRLTVSTPASAAPSGIRPEIHHAADGYYYCISRDPVGGTIAGLSVGSPFSGWSSVPMPDAALVQVRAVVITQTKTVFMGITYDAVKDKPYTYTFFSSNSTPTTGQWVDVSPLGIAGVSPADCAWAMGLYGDGAFVKTMAGMLSQPAALGSYPTSPVTPPP